jgi:hypothetical protein
VLLKDGIEHHEDGGYIQITCSKKVLKNLAIEGSLGGMFSQDTTTPPGSGELDQKGINAVASVALKYYFGNSGFNIQFECDGVKNTGLVEGTGPSAVLCLAGFGATFGAPHVEDVSSSSKSWSAWGAENVRDSIATGWAVDSGVVYSRTNHGGTDHSYGANLSASKYFSNGWVTRVGLMTTGDDGGVNNYQGVDGVIQKQFPVGNYGTKLYTGLGIYLERDDDDPPANKYQTDITMTFLGIEQNFGHAYGRLEYDRLARTNNADIFAKDGADSDYVLLNAGYKW